jgi:hypothetical protein
MNGRFKWCGACWVKGQRREAVLTLRGLPVCSFCESDLIDSKEKIKVIKEKWDAMPDIDSGPSGQQAFTNVVSAACSTSTKPSIALKIGELNAVIMPTAAYVAKFGSIKSKGMRRETMELWERLQILPMMQCLVIDVPDGKDPSKMRVALSNTIQRLVRINKPPYHVVLGANQLKKLVVIAKEPAQVPSVAKPA